MEFPGCKLSTSCPGPTSHPTHTYTQTHTHTRELQILLSKYARLQLDGRPTVHSAIHPSTESSSKQTWLKGTCSSTVKVYSIGELNMPQATHILHSVYILTTLQATAILPTCSKVIIQMFKAEFTITVYHKFMTATLGI